MGAGPVKINSIHANIARDLATVKSLLATLCIPVLYINFVKNIYIVDSQQ